MPTPKDSKHDGRSPERPGAHAHEGRARAARRRGQGASVSSTPTQSAIGQNNDAPRSAFSVFMWDDFQGKCKNKKKKKKTNDFAALDTTLCAYQKAI